MEIIHKMDSKNKINSDVARIAFGNKKTKKISINLDEETIDFIDEIAKSTRTTRTFVMLGALTTGIEPFLKNLETSWYAILSSGNLNEEKKKKVKEIIAVANRLRIKLLGGKPAN